MLPKGTIVRCIKSSGPNPPWGQSFTEGKEYVVGGTYYNAHWDDTMPIESDNLGRSNAWGARNFVEGGGPW